jgi:hypothetical protein
MKTESENVNFTGTAVRTFASARIAARRRAAIESVSCLPIVDLITVTGFSDSGPLTSTTSMTPRNALARAYDITSESTLRERTS